MRAREWMPIVVVAELDLGPILDGFDRSLLTAVQRTIETRDPGLIVTRSAPVSPAIRPPRSRSSGLASQTRPRVE